MFLRQFTGNNNLGDGSFAIYGRCSRPKEILAQLATALIGGGISAIAGSKSASAMADAQAKASAIQSAGDARNTAMWWRNRYDDNTELDQWSKQAREIANENSKRVNGDVTGASDALKAQTKEAGNKMVGDIASNLYSQKKQYDRQADQTYANAMNASDTAKANLALSAGQAQAQNIATAGSNTVNSISNLGNALEDTKWGKNIDTKLGLV